MYSCIFLFLKSSTETSHQSKYYFWSICSDTGLYVHWSYFLMIQEGLLRGQPSVVHRTSIKVEWVGISAPFTLPGYIQGSWNPDLLWAFWIRLSTGRTTGKGEEKLQGGEVELVTAHQITHITLDFWRQHMTKLQMKKFQTPPSLMPK